MNIEEEIMKEFELTKTGNLDYLDNTGCSFDSIEEYILGEVLGFCGCGDPVIIAIQVILPFLKKIEKTEFGNYEDYEYMFLCYFANDKGILEHGTTARCSWLTKKGKLILEYLLSLN